MSRKRALLMLVVVLLWIAAPAFACFMPAHHACCRQVMQDCATMRANPTCCQVRQSRSDIPPARASRTDRPVQIAAAGSNLPVIVPALEIRAPHRDVGTAPPPSPPGSTVLRI